MISFFNILILSLRNSNCQQIVLF